MAFTYILYSSELDRYYIGHTDHSLEERIQKHLSDHAGFTSKAKDWQLVFQKPFKNKTEAYAFERVIKNWKSRRAIENLIKDS
jgi:putative endonuclease